MTPQLIYALLDMTLIIKRHCLYVGFTPLYIKCPSLQDHEQKLVESHLYKEIYSNKTVYKNACKPCTKIGHKNYSFYTPKEWTH